MGAPISGHFPIRDDFLADVVPVAILGAVLSAILLRPAQIKPWQAMVAGGVAAAAWEGMGAGEIASSIDWDVMAFLYGMFVLAALLVESGYLAHLGYKVLRHFSEPFSILLAFIFSAAAGSFFLLNDTVAIIGVPLAALVARKSGIRAAPLIAGLALAVTYGSIASPMGNPQNFIIASQPAFVSPFVDFFVCLAVPSAISLFALAGALWLLFPELNGLKGFHEDVDRNGRDYMAARTSFLLVLGLSLFRALAEIVHSVPEFGIWWIALAGAGASVLLAGKPKNLLKAEFETLAFFAGMFVLMRAAWDSGFFQQFLPPAETLSQPFPVLAASLLLSQVLSNVPFVILYLNALGAGVAKGALLVLAAGSTLAGAITVFGAASNIIVMQAAEKRGETLPLKEFTVAGIACTAICIATMLIWMRLIG